MSTEGPDDNEAVAEDDEDELVGGPGRRSFEDDHQPRPLISDRATIAVDGVIERSAAVVARRIAPIDNSDGIDSVAVAAAAPSSGRPTPQPGVAGGPPPPRTDDAEDSARAVRQQPSGAQAAPSAATMFKKPGGFGGFGFSGLKSMADSAIKAADSAVKATKAAGEQLGVSAPPSLAASRAGSTSDLSQPPQSAATSRKPSPSPTPSTVSNIPPGLEDLSQEERDRIMAVMACAQLDMEENSRTPQMTASTVSLPALTETDRMPHPVHGDQPPRPHSSADAREIASIARQIESTEWTSARSPAALGRPPEGDVDLSFLTPEERARIEMVMSAASADLTASSMSIGSSISSDHLEPRVPVHIPVTATTAPSAQPPSTQPATIDSARPLFVEKPKPPPPVTPSDVGPDFGGVDLSFLTPAERAQIEMVMSAYNADMDVPATPEPSRRSAAPSPAFADHVPTLVHEALGDATGASTRRMSLPKREQPPEVVPTQQPRLSFSTGSFSSDTGYASSPYMEESPPEKPALLDQERTEVTQVPVCLPKTEPTDPYFSSLITLPHIFHDTAWCWLKITACSDARHLKNATSMGTGQETTNLHRNSQFYALLGNGNFLNGK